ncbi:hypothetical protein BJ875DRAFT_487474 [Amylocarpus encephaloides]|uniref:Uncharacterized protein n=1 Tax=Amylocarpus encephaloides TaxID=45428 RepID=A0A9P7YC76_9HELO|nr:hypothetical protein BJ875DRAFT_487474 [Amylocarpus encephaloides]
MLVGIRKLAFSEVDLIMPTGRARGLSEIITGKFDPTFGDLLPFKKRHTFDNIINWPSEDNEDSMKVDMKHMPLSTPMGSTTSFELEDRVLKFSAPSTAQFVSSQEMKTIFSTVQLVDEGNVRHIKPVPKTNAASVTIQPVDEENVQALKSSQTMNGASGVAQSEDKGNNREMRSTHKKDTMSMTVQSLNEEKLQDMKLSNESRVINPKSLKSKTASSLPFNLTTTLSMSTSKGNH